MMLALLCLLSGPGARADNLLPQPVEALSRIRAEWVERGAAWVSPVRAFDVQATRLGALVQVEEPAFGLRLEAALIDEGGRAGPWVEVPMTSAGEGWRVLVLDLEEPASRARVRLSGAEEVVELGWELLVPVNEARRPLEPHRAEPPSVSTALTSIGVVSRESWGSRSTTCTTTEDDWYRVAVHHTAGNQTSGGTVQGAVQALQAYSMDSAGYCDIPYQFLVGYDGTLWEGRNLNYYSGATGGGNNEGNVAVSFLGCYTASGCPGSSHDATDGMMAWARVLIQTLAVEHAFTTTDDVLKGHRDWPGNSTVCPGDYVYARLDELQSSTSYYQGSLTATSWSGTLPLTVGVEAPLTVELLNVGMNSWEPGITWLAPTPRDQDSALAGSDWAHGGRAATVGATVPPGGVGSFSFHVGSDSVGSISQSFSLVQESVTWFADLPYGGGPADDGIQLQVQLSEGVTPGDTGLDTGGSPDGGAPGDGGGGAGSGDPLPGGGPPGSLQALPEGSSCTGCASPGPGPLGLTLLAIGPLLRRRRV